MKNKRKKRKDPYNLKNADDILFEDFSVSSASECTGLIPAEPDDSEQRDSYKEIYDIN